MSVTARADIVVVNPLPEALGHYEDAVLQTLAAEGLRPLLLRPGIEVRANRAKVPVAIGRVASAQGRAIAEARASLVLWPAFGYLESAAWALRRMGRRRDISIVMHDVTPLRHQLGYGPASIGVARWVARLSSSERYVVHSGLAAAQMARWGLDADILPHPIVSDVPDRGLTADGPIVILGQYKPTRNLQVLADLAETAPRPVHVIGRGWPQIDGCWVEDRFLSESEFDDKLASAGCIVIPYDQYWQSGVAVRALEIGVPVVGLRHPQLEELYGSEWCGMVEDAGDWKRAIDAALEAGRAQVGILRRSYAHTTRRAWSEWLENAINRSDGRVR